jgi:hypothetical protein
MNCGIPMKTKKATIQLILNSVFYCNLYLLHLISEKIWLHHRTVSVAPEQRNLQSPSNIAVIVTSLYVPTVSASTEHLKALCRITSLMPKYQLIYLLN